jgi:two-component system OmpR family response regulator
MTKVLVVEDDPGILRTVADNLRFEQYVVVTATDGETAYALHRKEQPDLIVLDLMLPRMSGLELCRKLRMDDAEVPVLMLTARGEEADRVRGLDLGGDDYVTKPFSLEEVVARLRGLIRRSGAADRRSESVLVVGDLTLDEDSHEVSRSGDNIHLTATEFELLRFLMRNPRRVLSKAQILDRVWSYDFGGQANVVELYISYLRRKIDAGREPMIHTRRGAGYLIKPAAS